MRQAALTTLLVLAMLASDGIARGRERAYPAWQPPVPKDGIERPASGLLAMPRELRCWGVTLVRETVVHGAYVLFHYKPISGDRVGTARGAITVCSFREAGSAHAALELVLRSCNMSGTPWTRFHERVNLRDLVYRSVNKRLVIFHGVTRHTLLTVQANMPEHTPSSERDTLVVATQEATEVLIGAIESAGSALAVPPRTIGEIRLERIPGSSTTRRHGGELRLTVLPRTGQEVGSVSVQLTLFWRLQTEEPVWRGQHVYVPWLPDYPSTHGHAQSISLHPRAASEAYLELKLVRSHDDSAAYALEDVDFEIAEGANTATWMRSE